MRCETHKCTRRFRLGDFDQKLLLKRHTNLSLKGTSASPPVGLQRYRSRFSLTKTGRSLGSGNLSGRISLLIRQASTLDTVTLLEYERQV